MVALLFGFLFASGFRTLSILDAFHLIAVVALRVIRHLLQ
jgi:hypothetical protein